jgi:hypothetical protein
MTAQIRQQEFQTLADFRQKAPPLTPGGAVEIAFPVIQISTVDISRRSPASTSPSPRSSIT